MGGYLFAIWKCRYFWLSLVRLDLRNRYRRSVLGVGWSLLHPILMTIIICTVFHQLFKVDIQTFAPLLLSGLACWNYILNSAASGCHCFLQGESYIRQCPVPLAVYPLRTALGGLIHFLIAMVVVTGSTFFFRGHLAPVPLLTLIPTIGMLFLLSWSLGVLTGFANVYFQDTQHLTDVCFQMLFYVSPIMLPEKMFEGLSCGWVLKYNPLLPFLRLVRQPLLDDQVPSLLTYAWAGGVVLTVMIAASILLAKLRRGLIFHL